MPHNEFYAPDDIDLLRMENELLAFEVRHLKSRLGEPAKISGSATSLNRLGYLEDAERDLILLLRRLAGPPTGPLLRRLGSFRTLEQKYLRAAHPRGSSTSPERLASSTSKAASTAAPASPEPPGDATGASPPPRLRWITAIASSNRPSRVRRVASAMPSCIHPFIDASPLVNSVQHLSDIHMDGRRSPIGSKGVHDEP